MAITGSVHSAPVPRPAQATALAAIPVDVRSITSQSTSLAELFALIEYQTGFEIEYPVGELPLGAEVPMAASDSLSLSHLLALITTHHRIQFQVRDKQIEARLQLPPDAAPQTQALQLASAGDRVAPKPAQPEWSPPAEPSEQRQEDRRPDSATSGRAVVARRIVPATSLRSDAPTLARAEAVVPSAVNPVVESVNRRSEPAVIPRVVQSRGGSLAPTFAAPDSASPVIDRGPTDLSALPLDGKSHRLEETWAVAAKAKLEARIRQIVEDPAISGATREKRMSLAVRAAVSEATSEERDTAKVVAVAEGLVAAAVAAAPRFVDVIATAGAFTPSVARIQRGAARVRSAAYSASRAEKN